MRVAMLSEFPAPGTLPGGGPQIAATRLVPELVQRGVDVVVVAPAPWTSTETEFELEGGGRLVAIPTGTRLQLMHGFRTWRRGARAAVERIGVDVVHGQNLLPGGIAAAGIDGVPRIVTSRGNMREDTIADYTGVGGAVRAHLRERLARVAFKSADVVVSVNPDWRINLPAQPKRFHFIPNIVDEDFFARTHDPEPGLVLFAGGDNAIKGWDLLEEAWPRVREAVPEARLHVLGWRSDERPDLGDQARFEGWVSSRELADRMARASALVIASEFEVSPTVLAEAWAVGLPVVATAVGGIPALATDAAVLVQRTPDALAEGLVAALSGGDQIERVVAEATRRVERHRAAAVAAAHAELYDQMR
jgi:glycosyltransferase involved in cell wall biosynthesis